MRTSNVDWEMALYGGAVHSFTAASAGSDAKTGQAYNAAADKRSFEVFTDLVTDLFFRKK